MFWHYKPAVTVEAGSTAKHCPSDIHIENNNRKKKKINIKDKKNSGAGFFLSKPLQQTREKYEE